MGTLGLIIFFVMVSLLIFKLVAVGMFFVKSIKMKMDLAHQVELKNLELEHQSKLLETTFRAQEKERQEIAKNLHDDIGNLLSIAHLNLSTLANDYQIVATEMDKLNVVRESLNLASVKVKDISKKLSPPALEKFGLAVGLKDLCQIYEKASKIRIQFVSKGYERSLSKEVEVYLYRIIQELISNSMKYAQANLLEVIFIANPPQFEIVVKDNGKGFNFEEAMLNNHTSMGLRNVHSRVKHIQGSIDFESNIGRGTSVKIKFENNGKIF